MLPSPTGYRSAEQLRIPGKPFVRVFVDFPPPFIDVFA